MGELDPTMTNGVAAPEAVGANNGGDFVMDSGHFMSGLGNRRVAYGLAGMGAVLGGGLAAEAAIASPPEPVPGETQTVHVGKTTIKVPGEAAVDVASSRVNVVFNHRTVSKAEYKADLKAGRCDFFTSEEMIEMGVKTAGHTGEEYDSRASHLCDGDGDGDYDYRGECGNEVTLDTPNREEAEANVWANSADKFKAKVRSVALAIDSEYCKIGESYSLSYARAKAVAFGKLVVKGASGAKVKAKGISSKLTKMAASVKKRAFANLKSQTSAVALAQAKCEDMGGEVVPPTEVPPKDDTQGPGVGTPGQPGGGSPGTEPGNPGEGVICRDPADSTNGDLNPGTEGENMYGAQVDQFGYCVGPASELQ